MPEPLTTRINNWRVVYGHIFSDLYNAHNHLNYAAGQAAAENWNGLSIQLELVADYIYNASFHFKGGSPNLYSTMYYGMDWIDDNWPEIGEPPTLDMAAILDAVWKSKGGQTMDFILYIDAMRGSISEKTVFAPYLESYLRHFQK